jgi:hypothetical protein
LLIVMAQADCKNHLLMTSFVTDWPAHQIDGKNRFLIPSLLIKLLFQSLILNPPFFPKLIQSSKFHLIGSNSIHSFFFKLWAHSAAAQRIPLSTWFSTWKWGP